jgi:hypothetical protein
LSRFLILIQIVRQESVKFHTNYVRLLVNIIILTKDLVSIKFLIILLLLLFFIIIISSSSSSIRSSIKK